MTSKETNKTAKIIRLTARIIALPVTLFFLFWFTFFAAGSILTDLHGTITTDLVPPVISGILVLAAYTMSWRRERVGGILFVLVSAALGIYVLVSRLSAVHIVSVATILKNTLLDWAIFGLPVLIVGILFLVAAKLSKKIVCSELKSS
jgi:hypothetical protein